MMIVTTETIPGKKLEAMEMVQGSVVQSKHVGKDLMAGFKTIVGGEIKSYTEMMNEARAIATQRMAEQAQNLGADAVVAVRFVSSAVMQGAAELVAYGTAVRIISEVQE